MLARELLQGSLQGGRCYVFGLRELVERDVAKNSCVGQFGQVLMLGVATK